MRRGSGVRAQGGAGRGVAGARERGQTAVACARSELGPSVGAHEGERGRAGRGARCGGRGRERAWCVSGERRAGACSGAASTERGAGPVLCRVREGGRRREEGEGRRKERKGGKENKRERKWEKEKEKEKEGKEKEKEEGGRDPRRDHGADRGAGRPRLASGRARARRAGRGEK